jgi:ATP-dependent RNA/DNA helicase IGHMBP2
MTVRRVPFGAPLVLVAGSGLLAKFEALADRQGFPRSPYDVQRDLNELTAAGGVPVTLSEPLPGKADWSVLVYTRRYVVRLFVTKRHADAYTVASVAPLRLTDHQRLARACLLLRPSGWQVVGSTRDIPQGATSCWTLIDAEWRRLTESLAVSGQPTAAQEAFLRTLSAVIEATRRITTDRDADGSGYPYSAALPTAGARSGAAQLYEFTIAGARVPDLGVFVQVSPVAASAAGIRVMSRGQVTRADGGTVTIRFDEPVNWNDLQGQGEITPTTNDVVYRQQRTAVAQLRSGRARNPGILAVLVNGRAEPPGAGQQLPRPAFPLNSRQRLAFEKTLAGPDLLAVIGPPGTGKTTTIAEIVRAAAGRGERVIVCSQNNRAVDNVLSRLPSELLAIRIGNEARVTPEGIPYLLQRQAADLREQALGTARRSLAAYGRLDEASEWAAELARASTDLADAREAARRALYLLEEARRAVGGPATAEVDRLAAVAAAREREAGRGAARAQRLRQRADRAGARASRAVVGWIFALLARRWSGRFDVEQQRAEALASALRDAKALLAAARRHLAEVTKDAPAVIGATSAVRVAERRAGQEREAALGAARAATELVIPTGVKPPFTRNNGLDVHAVEPSTAQTWLETWLPLLSVRRDLLARWADEASGETDQLYPELIRYADVLAATCTGAGSRPELADLQFDLAIVDEAGQIGVADALIPLVRARRAVLVGDHMQLPPFLDSDVQAWGNLVGDPVVQSMLTKSALEMAVRALPSGSPHVVWLTEQRRMPRVIAEFASARFYGGQLETPPDLRRLHEDELFGSALAFVDTSAVDWARRQDRSGRHRERWGQLGYDNPQEARLLAALAVHYGRLHRDWAVIVPYRAQAELIRDLLTGRAGDAEKVRLNVGTVDSFQGGERDVILYGFTRSNPRGDVGFLRELRRVNVAITRAREQLVLVGDLETLTSARDDGFRDLARSLRDHATRSGEIVSYGVAAGRLRAAEAAR